MRYLRPKGAPALVGALVAAVSACQQTDQELPFELDEGVGQTASIGTSGGLVSVPPSFSMQFPSGSLPGTTSITAVARSSAFPTTAGTAIPGSAFDVGPAGVALAVPARVQLAVSPTSLAPGDELRLSVGLLQTGGTVVTSVSSYDLSNGILTGPVDEVGPVAAVLADVVPVLSLVSIPSLGGGVVSPAPPRAAPAQAPGDPELFADCSDDEGTCLGSGIVQVWVDDVVLARLGDPTVLAGTSVTGSVSFLDFVGGLPTMVLASIEIEGELRTRLNSIVVGRSLEDELFFHTGPAGSPPAATAVTFGGNVITLAQTSEGADKMVPYEVIGTGTSQEVILRLEGEIEFTDPTEIGQVAAHVRLSR